MIVLINPFDVPSDVSDDDFLAGWQRAADFLQGQPGFVSSALHRAVAPEARFRFVNVASWESPEAFRAAVGHSTFAQIARDSRSTGYPALYQVIRTIQENGADGGATQPALAGKGDPS